MEKADKIAQQLQLPRSTVKALRQIHTDLVDGDDKKNISTIANEALVAYYEVWQMIGRQGDPLNVIRKAVKEYMEHHEATK